MNQIGVLQICDSLAAGGMERVAVNLANGLPRDRFRSHICATRADGPMLELVHSHVKRICLHRAGRFDHAAVRRLVAYIRDNHIHILHAHGTSLFIASVTSLAKPQPLVIWHDHFGRYATEERPAWLYRLATKRVDAILTVNEPLATWARERLHFPADCVRYVPNFVCEPTNGHELPELPGQSGSRIVCVANFRQQKDHHNLLRAMRKVMLQQPQAHLILIGHITESSYFRDILSEIEAQDLTGHVSILGPSKDVYTMLRGCDLGVLSSSSEGLPLALLEYGMVSLPVVATQVGQCGEVLGNGQCGLLVPPRDPGRLSNAILSLLGSTSRRQELGGKLRERVLEAYSARKLIQRITEVYENVLQPHGPSPPERGPVSLR
jgi:glycosyltransferase involved in cell wall biosynthesis